MKIIKSRVIVNEIEKLTRAPRETLERNKNYVVKIETTSSKGDFMLTRRETVCFLGSGYSRYDGNGIYYFARSNGDIVEIWLDDSENINSLNNIFDSRSV